MDRTATHFTRQTCVELRRAGSWTCDALHRLVLNEYPPLTGNYDGLHRATSAKLYRAFLNFFFFLGFIIFVVSKHRQNRIDRRLLEKTSNEQTAGRTVFEERISE